MIKKFIIPICFLTTINLNAREMWVIAYHPCYQWSDVSAQNVPWSHITHLSLGYLWPIKSGSTYTVTVLDGWGGTFQSWQDSAQNYITAGHNADKKVLCMLGGAGSNPDSIWNKATSTTNIDSFAANIKNVLEPLGFDGMDLDWEDNVELPKLVNLVQKLRAIWSDAVITIPTGPQGNDATGLAPAKNAVDAFMPMTYIDIAQWGGWLIPVPLTPLHSAGSNPYSVDYALNKWETAGVPDSMIMMGVGGFGSVWGDINDDGQAPIAPYSNVDLTGGAAGETYSIANDNVVTWSWVKQVTNAHPELVQAWDSIGKCSYWHTPTIDSQITVQVDGQPRKISLIFYETTTSMAEKKSYCSAHNMKGMMFWTLSEMIDGTSCPILETLVTIEEKSCLPAGRQILKISPNPFVWQTIIQTLDTRLQTIDKQIKIYDISGKLVEETENTVIGKNLKAGVYFVKFGNSESVKVIKLSLLQ